MKKDEQVEVVPLHVWFYEAILNVLWPPFNYYRLHFLYISLVSILGTHWIWSSSLSLTLRMARRAVDLSLTAGSLEPAVLLGRSLPWRLRIYTDGVQRPARCNECLT